MQKIDLKIIEQDFRTREAFNTLRTNVEFSSDELKVISVTSCTPNEGKSYTSFELAKSFALNGKKTLLIDADLRKSVLRSRHQEGGNVTLGLSNVLVGKANVSDAICVTNIKNLAILFSGPFPPNPSELLGNARFEKLIEVVRNGFEVVIIDSPPLGSVIDTVVLSKYCDGVILVIESGSISYKFARQVKEQLTISKCKILGVVLNKVDIGKKAYGYYGGVIIKVISKPHKII